MQTPPQIEFLRRMNSAARLANHAWPQYAACEAALETAWGTSELYQRGNNVFGEKQHREPIFLTMMLPTEEVEAGRKVTVNAAFVWFPSVIESFVTRMKTLRRLAYVEYVDALAAVTGEDFIRHVSRRWSTDPERAAKVLAIHDAHRGVFAGTEQV